MSFLISGTEYDILADIAEEYEAIGNYALAEEHWDRCCAIAPHDALYKYIARKGDFLYRTERYGEAIAVYGKTLKILNNLKDKDIGIYHLKYYATVSHFIILAYNYLGKHNLKEKYHSELKHEIISI